MGRSYAYPTLGMVAPKHSIAMTTPYNRTWTCPYCTRIATIVGANVSRRVHYFDNNNKRGRLGFESWVVVCPNGKCREFTLEAGLYKTIGESSDSNTLVDKPILQWRLKPQSSAKPFPDYIPAPIIQDYEEAVAF